MRNELLGIYVEKADSVKINIRAVCKCLNRGKILWQGYLINLKHAEKFFTTLLHYIN